MDKNQIVSVIIVCSMTAVAIFSQSQKKQTNNIEKLSMLTSTSVESTKSKLNELSNKNLQNVKKPNKGTKPDLISARPNKKTKSITKPLSILTADVRTNSARGGFAQFGKNINLKAGKYRFRLIDSTVRYGEGQKISEIVLLRMNIESKYAYFTLNGIGDSKNIDVPTDCTLSVFFVPGEPIYDDSGSATVEIFWLGYSLPSKKLKF